MRESTRQGGIAPEGGRTSPRLGGGKVSQELVMCDNFFHGNFRFLTVIVTARPNFRSRRPRIGHHVLFLCKSNFSPANFDNFLYVLNKQSDIFSSLASDVSSLYKRKKKKKDHPLHPSPPPPEVLNNFTHDVCM